MEEANLLEIAAQLRDVTRAQLAAVRAGRWEEAAEYLQQRAALLERLHGVDPHQLNLSTRDAMAALLGEVQELDHELLATVEHALEQTRIEQRTVEQKENAIRGYRRALGTSGGAELIDEEA